MSARLPDWESRWLSFLDGLGDPVTDWGIRDCALLGADNVLAVTDDDPAAEFRGRYTTELGAAKALRRWGAGSLEATVDAKFPVIPPSLAQRADLAFCGGNLGIVLGSHALFLGEVESRPCWVREPRHAWDKAWAVGRGGVPSASS